MIKLLDTNGNVVYVNMTHVELVTFKYTKQMKRDYVSVRMTSGETIWVRDADSINRLATALMGQ